MKYIAPLHYSPNETVELNSVKVGMRLEVHMRTGKHAGREFFFTVCKISEDRLHDSCFELMKADLIKGMAEIRDRDYIERRTLAATLDAAIDGKATRQDVIEAITAELEADPEPYDMVEGEGAGQYTFDTPKDSQLAMF